MLRVYCIGSYIYISFQHSIRFDFGCELTYIWTMKCFVLLVCLLPIVTCSLLDEVGWVAVVCLFVSISIQLYSWICSQTQHFRSKNKHEYTFYNRTHSNIHTSSYLPCNTSLSSYLDFTIQSKMCCEFPLKQNKTTILKR